MTPRKPRSEHKPAGRPPWVPPADASEKVKRFLEIGYKRAVIAQYFEIDIDTLEKHFADEIRTARMDLLRRGMSKFQVAVLEGEEWALRFLLQNTAHGKNFEEPWAQRSELTGAGGADLFANLDMAKLSNEQFSQLKAILAAAGLSVPGGDGGPAAQGPGA